MFTDFNQHFFPFPQMRVAATACVVVVVVVASVCHGIVVFPESIAEQGLLPVPLFFGGLPIQVAIMFIGLYGVRKKNLD